MQKLVQFLPDANFFAKKLAMKGREKVKFLETYLKLQEKNENYIVLMRNGIFFLAIGKSAVALNKMINLKVICMKQEICKIGIPVKNINKYIIKIAEQKKSFVLYDYCKEGFPEEGLENYKQLFRFTSDNVKEERENINCNTCWYKERRIADNWKEEIKKIEKELKHE